MDKQELVSIVMPAYNAEKYIAEAIQSVLEQRHKHWELLIVNDGSKDNTGKIVQSFADPRIKYFEQENKGACAARNTALSNMNGSYLCVLDADDVLPQNSLNSRLAIFREDDRVTFADGKVLIMDDSLSKALRQYEPRVRGNPYRKLIKLNSD